MAVIKPTRESVTATTSSILINGIPVGEEIFTQEAHVITRWLQQNLPELLRAIKQAEENEQ